VGARCMRVVPPGDRVECRDQGQAGAALRSLRGGFDRREQCGAARLRVARVDDLDGQHPVLKALTCDPAR
jgi:hypothetical protein